MALMTSIRNQMHVVLWALLIIFILSMTIGGLVGGANIIDELLGRVDPGKAIGVVNGEIISPDDFSRMVGNQLEQIRTSGQEVTDSDLERVRQQVWNNIVQDLLVKQAVEDLGISATEEEVIYYLENNPPSFLRTNPAFQTDGKFDQVKYQQAISNPQGNEWAPVEQFMKNTYIPNYKLQQMILSSVIVTDEEIWDEYVQENVDFTIKSLHVTDRILDKKALQPSEEELKAAYKERIDEFSRPERRILQFVSWKKGPSKEDTLSVYNDALELKERALKGEDFATLANQYTEDPGNQVTPDSGRGGDLGWFSRNQMVPSFEKAAFNARPGEIVGPVLSNFGYHIIKVLDKKTENGVEKVRAAHILLRITMGPRTRDYLRRQATLFSYDAQDFGFAAALDTHKVAAKKSKPFDDAASYVTGLGPMRSAVRFAFDSQIGDVSEPLENDDYFAVVSLDSIIPPGPASFEEVKYSILRDMLKERTMEAAKKIADELYQRIQNGATIEELAAENKDMERVFNDTKKLNRGFSSIGRNYYLIGALLDAKPGDIIGPYETKRGYAITELVSVQPIDTTDFETKKNVIKEKLLRTKQGQAFNDWLSSIKAKAEIIDNRKYYF
ncbi:MAG: hypothetical protein GXO92_07490 [FCB group bacterium]|nr:hypothetical protein [FCB group bacterium]